uniref:Coiled-coil domain-containing protein 43 n=1 Tax=Mola mola TaxID=94237 RepID=A0A3Q3X865_MOLML
MAAPVPDAGEFESWLNDRLDCLEVDREVYGAYILGVLQEEETDAEKEDALQGILSAFLVIIHSGMSRSLPSTSSTDRDLQVEAIASMMEKQAQIVVRHKEVSEESKKRKEALLAQCSFLDKRTEAGEEEPTSGFNFIGNENSLYKNTNLEEVLNRQKQKRSQAREDAQKKKEMDKMQREKDKLTKQDRKEKEKKRTQKGERKR